MAFINGKEVQIIAVKGEKGDKGDPTDVKQVTGSNKDAVMSQKAVTDAFDNLGLYYQSYDLIRGTMYGGTPTPDVNMESYRMVTPELIQVRAGARIEFKENSIFKFGYAFYNSEKVYDGIDRGWLTQGVTLEENGYIYLNFGRVDETELTDSDEETIKKICFVVDNSIEKRIDEEVQTITDKFDTFGLYHRDYDIVCGNLQNGVISSWAGMSLTRAVTPEKIPVKAGMKILFNDSSGVYNFGYAFYDTDGVFDGIDRGWNKATVRLANDGYIALNFRRVDETEMSATDYANIKSALLIINDSVIGLEQKRINDDIKNSVYIEYGRKNGASYVFARIPKTTNDGETVTPRLALTSADGSLTGTKISPLAFAKRENTAFVINAGLFDMTAMQPVGQTIIDGVAVVSAPMEDDNGAAISETECYPLCIDENGDLSAPYARSVDVNTMISDGVKQAVVGWGKLVEDFKICTADIAAEIVHPSDYIRQSIGQFENGDYFVCTVEQSRGTVTNEAGMTYTELAELLIEKGAKFAYSLDGGGSAATVIGKRQLNRIYEGTSGRAVPTVIYFDIQ